MTQWFLAPSSRSGHPLAPLQAVESDSLERILYAARMMASSLGCAGWEFVVLRAPAGSEGLHLAPWTRRAPELLLITGPRPLEHELPIPEEVRPEQALEAILEHLTVASRQEGVSMQWIIGFNPEGLRKLLGLEQRKMILAATPLAESRSPRKGPRHPRRMGWSARHL